VHGKAVSLELQRLWIHNINISMGLVNTTSLGTLLKLVAQYRLPVDKFVTNRFSFDEVMSAYETFENAAHTGALKVLISR
jgi:alcohol dehydrogenase